MKSIIEYLDDLKEKTGSDYASALALGCDRSVISNMRKRGAIAEENAIKIADLLGIEQDELLVAAAIARSEGPVKAAWIKHAKRAGITASIILAMLTPPQDSNAQSLTPTFTRNQVCILCHS